MREGLPIKARTQRHADRLPQAVAQRATGHFKSRRNFAAGHLESRLIRTVGVKFIHGDYSSFGQGRIQADRVVPDREQKPVAVRPGKIVGVVLHLPEIEHRQ